MQAVHQDADGGSMGCWSLAGGLGSCTSATFHDAGASLPQDNTELRGLVEDAELEQAAFLYSPTGPMLFPGAVGGAWLLALLYDRTRVRKVTGRPPHWPPHWPLPPGACG